MAPRGSIKSLSVGHEDYVAKLFKGKRSASSGGADNDQGDVRTCCQLIEAKLTGYPGKPAQSISLKVNDLNKVAKEAYSEGKIPALALRIHNPESFLSDRHGNIDLIVHLMSNDSRIECKCEGNNPRTSGP
jgi:hypothetical protein